MPYVITTHSMPSDPHPGHRHSGIKAATARRAVATLEDARDWIKPIILAASPNHVWHLAESGGTVGPLPDGTVIEVQRQPDDFDVDAFNAREARHA